MDKVLLIGVNTGAEDNFEHSMEELALLAEACFHKCYASTIEFVTSFF